MVKVWNVAEDGDGKRVISLVTSRELGVVRNLPGLYQLCDANVLYGPQGKVFSTAWSPDDALTLVAGGSAGKLQVWDIGVNQNVRKTLGAKIAEAGGTLKEKAGGGVVGVVDDGEGDSDDEE
jgi:periodic tryptophan protein 1